MLLALDLATKLGWAVTPVRFGTKQLPKTDEDVGAFLCIYRDWLTAEVKSHEFEWVIFEAPILPNTTALITMRKLTGLANVTEVVCRDLDIKCREVHMQNVRKHFIGTTRAPKEIIDKVERRKWLKARIVAECITRGWTPKNDDEADALAIMDYANEVLKPGIREAA